MKHSIHRSKTNRNEEDVAGKAEVTSDNDLCNSKENKTQFYLCEDETSHDIFVGIALSSTSDLSCRFPNETSIDALVFTPHVQDVVMLMMSTRITFDGDNYAFDSLSATGSPNTNRPVFVLPSASDI